MRIGYIGNAGGGGVGGGGGYPPPTVKTFLGGFGGTKSRFWCVIKFKLTSIIAPNVYMIAG